MLVVEIKVNTKFEELDRVFLKDTQCNNGRFYEAFIPVEVQKIESIQHEVNQYMADLFKVKYIVNALEDKKEYCVNEKDLYRIKDLQDLVFKKRSV